MPKTSCGANAALRSLSARTIVAALADAAERWRDADFPPRVRATAAIETRTGYTTPVIDYALDRLFGAITREALTNAIAGELGSLETLDAFVERPGAPAAWARGADAVTIIASDTTIGVAVVPLVFALSAKCAVTVKDRADALVSAFVQTLGEERPELAAAACVRTWNGGEDDIEAVALGAADVVVAFGGDEALRAIRARCAPGATFVPFGHRASAGYVTRRALAGDGAALAAGIAQDALLYDGDGCLSLHLLFVERAGDGAHERFIQQLAEACAAHAVTFPPGRRSAARTARTNAFAAAGAFRAANGLGRALRAPDGAWNIVVDPPLDEVPPFGGGVIPVVYVDDAEAAGTYIRRHRIPLQALGVADPHDGDAAALAQRFGADRIARFGSMQDPPLAGHHGGRPRVADFIRWIDRA
jgi:hypothetical protein